MCTRCSDPQFKLFYTPIEAAVRWCGLQAHEHQIRQADWLYAEQLFKTFPEWPCLATHVAIILDAIRHGELSSQPPDVFTGADGNTAPGSFRIRHGDLKAWMCLYHPDQKPPFLFTCAADAEGSVKWGHYLVLKADRDTLRVLCERLTKSHADVSHQLADLSIELEQLRVAASDDRPVDARTEGAWLELVGVMLRLLLDRDPTDKRRPFFVSQDAIVSAIQEQYADHPGLGKRTVDQRFADANKRFKQHR